MNDSTLNKFQTIGVSASETARSRMINNDAPESEIENLRNLCALPNSYVGGSKDSQHKFGEGLTKCRLAIIYPS